MGCCSAASSRVLAQQQESGRRKNWTAAQPRATCCNAFQRCASQSLGCMHSSNSSPAGSALHPAKCFAQHMLPQQAPRLLHCMQWLLLLLVGGCGDAAALLLLQLSCQGLCCPVQARALQPQYNSCRNRHCVSPHSPCCCWCCKSPICASPCGWVHTVAINTSAPASPPLTCQPSSIMIQRG